MRRIIACTLAVFTICVTLGQNLSDSVKVYFNIGKSQFDPTIGDNAAAIDSFIVKIRKAADHHTLDHIAISAYASPDGSLSRNNHLSKKRCDAIASLIADRAGIAPELIKTNAEGVAWNQLRQVVEATPDVPSRTQILYILDNTPLWIYNSQGQIIDGRKNQLMSLNRGVPYRWMLHRIFPKLRNALAISVYLKADSCEEKTDNDEEIPESIEEPDTFHVADSIHVPEQQTPTEDTAIPQIPPRHLFALKTNLPYYAILLPNLELEWLINKHWSVAADGNMAWWGSYSHNKSYRIAILTSEARYWIKPRAPWHGLYAGVLAGGGWYDFENGSTGYYGEGLMTGLSAGYMWPIGRNLSLEAGAGAGYVYTRYKEYRPYEGHHLYLRAKSLNYFGPLKVKFSIVWRFFDVNKPKRTPSEI